MMKLRHVFIGIPCLFLGSCGTAPDPATETPVDLQPGQYQVTMGGGGLAKFIPVQKDGPGSVDQSICVTAEQAKTWPKPFVQNYLYLHEGCSLTGSKRVGNAVSGAILCPVDPDKAQGKMTVNYTGSMARDAVTVEAKMVFDVELSEAEKAKDPGAAQAMAAMKGLMGNISMIVKAKRTGECRG
jgi:hypothetical protein